LKTPLTGQKWIRQKKSLVDTRIDRFQLNHVTLQLGDVREMHGFDGIIGSDFFLQIN
jgi:hypothetical protein